jgi:hypothetical protein
VAGLAVRGRPFKQRPGVTVNDWAQRAVAIDPRYLPRLARKEDIPITLRRDGDRDRIRSSDPFPLPRS